MEFAQPIHSQFNQKMNHAKKNKSASSRNQYRIESNRSYLTTENQSQPQNSNFSNAVINGNPLRKYTRVIEMMNMNQFMMGGKGNNVKEEGQQCNLDDFTQGACTTINMSTPDGKQIGGETSSTSQYQQNHNIEQTQQEQQVINTDHNYNSSFYYNPRSQTAASQYLTQARQQTVKRNMASRASHRTASNTTDVTYCKVKMTKSLFKNQQEATHQKMGIPYNARPISKQSGAIRMLIVQNQDNSNSAVRNKSRQHYSRNTQSRNQDLNNSQLRNQSFNATQSNIYASKIGKDGGYISFQTNVDNSQALIPMILSNEDLMKTVTADDSSQPPTTTMARQQNHNDDLKKTILSRQFTNNKSQQPSRLQQNHKDAIQAQGRSAPQIYPRMGHHSQERVSVFINEQQQASSEEYSYQLSKRHIQNNHENPYSGMENQSRNYKSQNTSKMGGYIKVQNLKENVNSNNFSGAQKVKNFGFEQIPDYSQHKTQQIKEQYIKKMKNQSVHEGRNQHNQSELYQVLYSTNKLNQTTQQLTSQPLFLASTKKTPGLQKECAGSYVNVINNRTCLGQQNVFKFSMDLPLRLKQQMWRQHQIEKEKKKLLDEADKTLNENLNETMQDDSMTQGKPQLGLEIIGTQSRLQEMLTPSQQYHTIHQPMQQPLLNQSSSVSNLQLIHHWSPTSLAANNLHNAQTVELSKKDLLYLDNRQNQLSSPYLNQASVNRYQNKHDSTPKNHTHSQPFLKEPLKLEVIRPSQLKLNIQDSNIYSQAMSSENGSERDNSAAVNQQQQKPNQAIGKKSKIIYSINKSSQNQINSVHRSKNINGMDIIINSGTAQLRRSLDSRNSKKGNIAANTGVYGVNKSTVSREQNHEVSVIMQQPVPPAESVAISSMLVSQDHLLPLAKPVPTNPAKKLKDSSFADKSPDLMHLTKNPPPPPHPAVHESVQMPVIRSQNASFKRARKVTSAGKRHTTGGGSFEITAAGGIEGHIRNESQRLKMTSIEFEPEREFEHIHDFNITQISIKVDSKRNTLDLSSNLRLKTLSQALVKHKTLENKSIASQSSIVNNQQPKLCSSAKKSQIKKTISSTRNQNANEFLKIKQLSIHQRNLSGLQLTQPLSPRNNLNQTLEIPKQDSQSRYNMTRTKQIENKTILLKARAKSAAPKGQTILRTMTLVASVHEKQSNGGKKEQQESIRNSIQLNDSEGPRSSIEATQLQLIKPIPIDNIKIDPKLMVRPVTTQMREQAKLQADKTDQGGSPSDKKFMIIKENARDENLSPQIPYVTQQSQNTQKDEELMRKSTITIGYEDVGFFHQAKVDEGKNNEASNDYVDQRNIIDVGERYQLQAAMMEKVIVKSPGRQTTDHVVSSFHQEANITVSNFNNLLLQRDNSNQHHRRLSSGGKSGSNTLSRRRSFMSNNNKDIVLQDGAFGELSPTTAAKRTVLIRKSKGQNDVSEIIVNTSIGQKDSVGKNTDKNGNAQGKTMAYGNKVNAKRNWQGTSLPTNQFLSFEEIEKKDLNNLAQTVGSSTKVNIIGKKTELPRHGHAPPSVVKRNQETMNKKKAQKEGNFTLNNQTSLYGSNTAPCLNSRAQTATGITNNQMAATFYILPQSHSRPQMNPQSTGFNTQFPAKKSKSPQTTASHSFYAHTSQLQALVIHSSELAIDSSQQRMQLRLIQAYHDHQQRMQIMQSTPLYLQNERVVTLSQPSHPLPPPLLPQHPQVMVPQPSNLLGVPSRDGGGIDSEDATTQPPPLLLRDIRESASIASIKGEVVLTNRTGQQQQQKRGQLGQQAKSKQQKMVMDTSREEQLAIVGTNMHKTGEQEGLKKGGKV